MKKLVLVLVCTLILAVFIAFNYLLWDRERKIESINNLNINKNATIEALSEQIRNLDQTNKELKLKLEQSEQQAENLRTNIYSLNSEISNLEKENDYRNRLIGKLKEIADLQPLMDKIVSWADAINEGNYANAYGLLSGPIKSRKPYSSLQEFSSGFKSAVEGFKVESVKLHEDVEPGADQKDFIFDVSISVDLAEGSSLGEFKEGLNEKLFTIVYIVEMDDWVIYDISDISG